MTEQSHPPKEVPSHLSEDTGPLPESDRELDAWLGGKVGEWIGLTWEPPPRTQNSRGAKSLPDKFATQLVQLKSKPGTWGRIAAYASKSRAYSNAQTLRKKVPHYEFRPARLDFVRKGVPVQGSGLWARYVPGPRGENV